MFKLFIKACSKWFPILVLCHSFYKLIYLPLYQNVKVSVSPVFVYLHDLAVQYIPSCLSGISHSWGITLSITLITGLIQLM